MSAIASIPDQQPEAAAGLSPAEILEAVVALSREAALGSGEADVADAIVRIAGELLGADQGTLGVVRNGEIITIAALMPRRQPVGTHFPVGFGVAGWVAATGQAAEIQDVRQDKRYVVLPYPEVRSFVGVPLQTGGQLLGVLSLAAWRPGAFPSRTAEALGPFAEHAALLLLRAATEQQLRERLSRLEHATHEGLAAALHELKAPLHAAAGFIELVATEAAGPLNEQQRDFLQTAHGECLRLKTSLAELVEAGAVAAQQQRPLQHCEVEPGEIVATAVERHRGQALRRGVQLRVVGDAAAQAVRVDEEAILQVLANFLQNALRFAPAGSEIVVSTTADGPNTCFAVADSGPGVPSADLASIFEPFEQGQPRQAGSGEVGLGLAISRRIIEEHAGQIWAENRPGGGSRFCFALPAISR
jgi:signal transduction histidine kinase